MCVCVPCADANPPVKLFRVAYRFFFSMEIGTSERLQVMHLHALAQKGLGKVNVEKVEGKACHRS